MIRNFKALGLALIAVFAMSALVASAAQAAAGEFTAESYPVTLTGSQVGTNTLTVGNGARVVSCTTASATGTLAGTSTTLTLTPSYSGCTSTGALPATVTVNGCDFSLTSNTVTATTGTGSATVACPAGKEIIVDIYASAAKHAENVRACEYHIAAQGPLSAGEYHLEGAGSTREITATLAVKPATKNTVGSKLLCGLAAEETGTSTLAGTQTLTGENAAGTAHIGVFVS